MYRLLCLLLALSCLLPAACAEEKYAAFPEALRITQKREKKYMTDTSYRMLYYPKTCSEEINAELREIIDRLDAENLPLLPRASARKNESAMLDTGATVYRTGDRWASFLMVSSVMNGGEQLAMRFDTRAYDMVSQTPLTLRQVIMPEGFPFLQQEAKAQLTAYFPQYETDAQKLDALCDIDALRDAHFTLSPAYLQLHFPSEALYPHAGVILHVRIPYTLLAPYLTDEARQQTDNSRYKLIALTYDDGPTRRQTTAIVRALRGGGLNATFFLVGDRMAGSHDLILMEHNSGFTVASHNYEHIYANAMAGKVHAYRERFDQELSTVTGCRAAIMRAPGGLEQIYVDEQVGLPLIHWSLASKDGKSTDFDPLSEAMRLTYSLKDGSIVLMHDLRAVSADYSAYLPQLLNDRGYLCVTVEELFALRGIPLEPNTVYRDECILP